MNLPEYEPNTVRFTPQDYLYAKGRNNLAASSGVHVRHWGAVAIALLNVTSKGEVSDAARLVLPIANIPELVNILLGFYAGPLGKLALNPPTTTE